MASVSCDGCGADDTRNGRPMKLIPYLCLSFFLLASLWAQTTTLRGVVTDESGAVIPGASVTLNGPGGLVKATVAGNDGSYTFSGLSAGNYAVQASTPQLVLPKPVGINLRSGIQT